jgi:hypothetical protein
VPCSFLLWQYVTLESDRSMLKVAPGYLSMFEDDVSVNRFLDLSVKLSHRYASSLLCEEILKARVRRKRSRALIITSTICNPCMSIRPAAQESSRYDLVLTARMLLPSSIASKKSLLAIKISSYAIFFSVASTLTLYMSEVAGRYIPLLTSFQIQWGLPA